MHWEIGEMSQRESGTGKLFIYTTLQKSFAVWTRIAGHGPLHIDFFNHLMPRWITAIFWDKRNGQTFIRQKTKRVFFLLVGTPAKKCSTFAAHYSARPLHAAGERRERGEQFKQKNTEAPAIGIPQCFSNPTAALFIGF
jgi:hypothetical protein